MGFSFSESEPNCKAFSEGTAQVFRITDAEAPTFYGMATVHTAETLLIRERVKEEIAAGAEGKQIAAAVGLSPAAISNLISGTTGVRPSNYERWRRHFSYPTIEALQSAAYARFGRKAEDDDLLDEPALREAIETLAGLTQTPKEQLIAIARDLDAPRFRGREALYYVNIIGAILREEQQLQRSVHAEVRQAERDMRQRKTQVQGHMRAEHRRRRARKDEEAKPKASQDTPKRRRAAG